MSDDSPVVVIAFDSLDFDLARRWAEEGELPTFRRLFQTRTWSKVRNPPGFESGTAWMSFITGVMPDEHGVYDAYYRFDPDSYQIRIATPADTGWPSLWTRMSQAGRRVAVVDVPYSFVDPDLHGMQVCDWLVHVSAEHAGPKCNSPTTLREIHEKFGLNPISGPNRCPINEQEVHTVEGLSRVLAIEEQRSDWKTRFCAKRLAEGPWDFFMTVFHEAHDLGHMCWHAHDPTHERHNASVTARVGDPLLRIYKKLDTATDELISAAPHGSKVLVYSSHGIGPEHTASRLLDTILLELEKQRRAKTPRGWIERAGSVYHRLVPDAVRRQLGSSQVIGKFYAMRENERLRQRHCLAINPAYSTGGIHLNIAGRDGDGVVKQGEARAYGDWLVEEMTKLTNAETGEGLVDTVTETASLYSGAARRFLPDLLLDWNLSAPIRKVRLPQSNKVLNNTPSVRSGDHYLSKEGFVVSSAPGIPAGQRDTVGVADLSATLIALLGVDTRGLPGGAIPWLS
jgi:predicted AlkP superfamily phosphohydrolase/phosphomutase